MIHHPLTFRNYTYQSPPKTACATPQFKSCGPPHKYTCAAEEDALCRTPVGSSRCKAHSQYRKDQRLIVLSFREEMQQGLGVEGDLGQDGERNLRLGVVGEE
jgi:hypothetical protein